CEDIAAIPLLWVLPLTLYLLTFMMAFAGPRWYSRRIFWPLYALAIGIALGRNITLQRSAPALLIALYCFTIFAVCMVCHGELARSKPPSRYLTSFYWCIAGGGAMGGAIVILIAPQVLRDFWEFHAALLSCAFLIFAAVLLEDRSGGSEGPQWALFFLLLAGFLIPHLAALIPGLGRVPLLSKDYWAVPVCLLLWVLAKGAFPRTPAQPSAPHAPLESAAESGARRAQLAWQPVAALVTVLLLAL